MIDPIIEAAVEMMRDARRASQRNRNYYDGNFPSIFSRETDFTNPARRMIEGVHDNQIKGVIDATVDRLQVTGFRHHDAEDPVAFAQASRAWDLWQANGLDNEYSNFLTSLEVTGLESAIIVWPDGQGNTRIFPQEPEVVAFERISETGPFLSWLVKYYYAEGRANLIKYTEYSVEHWQSTNDIRDPDAYNYRLISEEPHPFGFVPAVPSGLNGISDVDLAAPLNDLLNHCLGNILIVSQYFSLPLRIVTGLEVELDPETGQKVPPFELGLNRTLFLPGAVAGEQPISFEQMNSNSPQALLIEANHHRRAIANVTRTPLHLIVPEGSFPSGEALKTAEASFISKVKGRMRNYGSALDRVMSMALVVETYLNSGSVTNFVGLSTVWDPPESESLEAEARVVDTLVKAGVPLETALVKVMGWDAETAVNAAQGNQAIEASKKEDSEAS